VTGESSLRSIVNEKCALWPFTRRPSCAVLFSVIPSRSQSTGNCMRYTCGRVTVIISADAISQSEGKGQVLYYCVPRDISAKLVSVYTLNYTYNCKPRRFRSDDRVTHFPRIAITLVNNIIITISHRFHRLALGWFYDSRLRQLTVVTHHNLEIR